MKADEPIIFVVDDDPSVRGALERLLRSAGLQCRVFASAREFLSHARPDAPACLVLDVQLPGLSGLDLQCTMATAGIEIPIIFITGHGDVPMSVRAMKAGAFEFLTKPFREEDLLDAIHLAIARDRANRKQQTEIAELRQRFDSLTPREREVLALIVTGLLNKQVADLLGTSEATVKIHRGRVMQKMQVTSLADLVRVAQKLGLPKPS